MDGEKQGVYQRKRYLFGLRAHVDVLVRERFIYKVGYSFNNLFIGCMSDHYSHILKRVS